ncbi:uncharacterized protein V1516DRAFT_671937 [Lipomyces oligophaga]|uniref:uncharacterized protein n=1 Tax=Lipomyces oligophaga TaxID=45792 RepID=UPI0034CFD5BE
MSTRIVSRSQADFCTILDRGARSSPLKPTQISSSLDSDAMDSDTTLVAFKRIKSDKEFSMEDQSTISSLESAKTANQEEELQNLSYVLADGARYKYSRGTVYPSEAEDVRETKQPLNNQILFQVTTYDGDTLPSLSSSYQYESRIDFSRSSSLREQRRRMCIEEFISTEEHYLSGLRTLVNGYLATIDSCGYRERDLVTDIRNSASELLEFHQRVLASLYSMFPALYAPSSALGDGYGILHLDVHLRDSVRQPASFESEVMSCMRDPVKSQISTWSGSQTSISSPTVACAIARLIEHKTAQLVLYEEYCLNYSNVFDILKMYQTSANQYRRHWSTGTEKFFMATQSADRRADLSLPSLAISPTMRFGKYRLLLEQLYKHTPNSDSTEANEELNRCLEAVKDNLRRLDDFKPELSKYQSSACELWRRIQFASDSGVNFTPEYLGRSVLCGALHTGWMAQDGSFRSQYYGAFLFKSTLILASIDRPERYIVRFLIPLCCSKIETANTPLKSKMQTGIQTKHSTSFKIVFEHAFGIYEVLLTPASLEEQAVWFDNLQTIICGCGGGDDYKWDYSASVASEEGVGYWSIVPLLIRALAFKSSDISPANIQEDSATNSTERRRRSVTPFGKLSPSSLASGRMYRRVSSLHYRGNSNHLASDDMVDIEINHFPLAVQEIIVPRVRRRFSVRRSESKDEEVTRRSISNRSISYGNSTLSPMSRRVFSSASASTPQVDSQAVVRPLHEITVKSADRLRIEDCMRTVWSHGKLALVTDILRENSELKIKAQYDIRGNQLDSQIEFEMRRNGSWREAIRKISGATIFRSASQNKPIDSVEDVDYDRENSLVYETSSDQIILPKCRDDNMIINNNLGYGKPRKSSCENELKRDSSSSSIRNASEKLIRQVSTLLTKEE